jgi:lipopolysaccharide transport system permease protein
MFATGAPFHLTAIVGIIPIFFLLVLIVGVGMILSVCNTYFTDVGHLYKVFTLILMYASALFYPMEIVPTLVQKIFTLNPVYCAISCFRECIVFGIMPDMSKIAYLAVFGLTTLFIGIILFKMYEKKLALEL